MVDMAGVHALTAELHTGFLTLAFLAIAGVLLCQLLLHYAPKRSSGPRLLRIREHLEPTGYVAIFAGVLTLVLSAITGSAAWSVDDLLASPLTRNKIVLTTFALVIWSAVLFMRCTLKRNLWTYPATALLYFGMATVAYAITAGVGSLGAHLTQGESVLDPFLGAVGIDLTTGMTLTSTVALVITIASVVVIIVVLLVARRTGIAMKELKDTGPGPWPHWDKEPPK
jgi:fumarate reductase subunit D